MRYILFFVTLAMTVMVGNSPVLAASPYEYSSPPAGEISSTSSPLKVSAYYLTKTQVSYIELYNDSDVPINPAEWELQITDASGVQIVPRFALKVEGEEGYIPPRQLITVSFNDAVANVEHQYILESFGVSSLATREFQLFYSGVERYARKITIPTNPLQVRLQFFAATSEARAAEESTIYNTHLYSPQTTEFPLAPIEILANPAACSAQVTACEEYVKFYNHTSENVSFAEVRLRSGARGQASTASNTVYIDTLLAPGAYVNIPISLTNTGAAVWLEDKYGVMLYESTYAEYPDASATSKRGHSWALGTDGWNWAKPQPSAPNTLLDPEDAAAITSGLTPCAKDQYRNPETNRCNKIEVKPVQAPCRADQYRNPETNRCRNISAASSQLAPCDADEYRSPETNRCRKLTASSSSLTPCKAGQYRSPETSRCRNLATASATQLKPCAADQERNPETNRCRKKIQGDGKAGFAVVDEPSVSDNLFSWVALGGVGAASLGYAGWEWRRELWGGAGKLFSLLPWVK